MKKPIQPPEPPKTTEMEQTPPEPPPSTEKEYKWKVRELMPIYGLSKNGVYNHFRYLKGCVRIPSAANVSDTREYLTFGVPDSIMRADYAKYTGNTLDRPTPKPKAAAKPKAAKKAAPKPEIKKRPAAKASSVNGGEYEYKGTKLSAGGMSRGGAVRQAGGMMRRHPDEKLSRDLP